MNILHAFGISCLIAWGIGITVSPPTKPETKGVALVILFSGIALLIFGINM